jgi:hypothetical protein
LLRGKQREWSEVKHTTERGRFDPETVARAHRFDCEDAKMVAEIQNFGEQFLHAGDVSGSEFRGELERGGGG